GVGLGFAARLFQCRGTLLLLRVGTAPATCLFLAARFLQGGDPDLLLALGLRRSLSLAAGFDLGSVCQILASPRIFDLSLPLRVGYFLAPSGFLHLYQMLAGICRLLLPPPFCIGC